MFIKDGGLKGRSGVKVLVAWGVALMGLLALGAASGLAAGHQEGAVVRDPAVEEDPSVRQIVIKGSDSLSKVLRLWAERYNADHPDVKVSVESTGSGTSIAGLLNGHGEVAATARPLRVKELRVLERRGMPDPINYMVARDGVAVIVHPDNPMREADLHKLANIYGREGSIQRWSDLGFQVPGCHGQRINLLSRKNTSGTYALFRMAIFGGMPGHFNANVTWRPTTQAVLEMVAQQPCAIGYVGSAYLKDAKVKPLCIAPAPGLSCHMPTPEDMHNYVLARPFYLVTLGKPAPELQGFLDWVTGKEAQAMLVKAGYLPAN